MISYISKKSMGSTLPLSKMLKKWYPEGQYDHHFVQTQLTTLRVSGNLSRD